MAQDSVFTQIPKINYSEEPPKIDPSEYEKVVKSRRSIRIFQKIPIPEEVTQKVLDHALLAPNSSNLQPWEFYRVKSLHKKQELVSICLDQPAAATAQELIVVVARTKTWKKVRLQILESFKKVKEEHGIETPKAALFYYEKLVPYFYGQGFLGIWGAMKGIFLWGRGLLKATPRGPWNESQMKKWASKTAALACQNIMLSYRAYGYDTCPMEGFDEARLKKLLNLAKDAEPVMVIGAGKRDSSGVYGPQIRMPKEQFVFEV